MSNNVTIQVLTPTLQKLVDRLSEAKALTPASAKKLVLETQVDEAELMAYADFEHPAADCYGRKLVYDGGCFEVMVMSWNPGDYSSIHNHGYTEWGVVQAFGLAQNIIFCVQAGELCLKKKEILSKGEAIQVSNQLIHQMGNPSSTPFLSLHVYGASSRSECVTADAKNFELEKDRIAHTTGGAFFNLPEDQVYDFEPAIPPTPQAFLHYASLLLNYYLRQEDQEAFRPKIQSLIRKISAYALPS